MNNPAKITVGMLATGDELIHGDTLNTNTHAIAHELSSEGIPLGLQLICGDKEEEIVGCLNFLSKNHDVIIVIGGLGPTTDDLTRFALAQFTKEPLVQHQQALDHIEERLQRAKVPMNQGNMQQCLFPEKATILPNPFGSAVGCQYQWHNKTFILLPGPPRECLPMFRHFVFPFLRQTSHSQKQIIKWRIFGLAESEIGQILEDALKEIDCQTGYRLEIPYIEFKVRCASDVVDKVKAIVDPILAPHSIGTVSQKASEVLHDRLVEKQETITIIDEVTGGLLQTLLEKPDTYSLLNFHNRLEKTLYFHCTGLKEYWTNQLPAGKTELKIYYRNQNVEGEEVHSIPYFGSLVLYYAAEWLSFRLLHLINQLH